MDHQKFLDIAFNEALKGAGAVSPNPRVGAVLVKENQVISNGYHQKYGEAHAEVNCLKDITDTFGCTLYVTLEPCCHSNKQTPPCTNLILDKKIKHVVVAGLDANPDVAGKGVKLLQDNGVKVEVIDHKNILMMNESFNHFINTKTPFIHLKWAQTLDGRIATKAGDSKWITNSESRKKVHQLRRMCDVVITSAGTVRADNPLLTARDDADWEYTPHRLIITRSGELSNDLKIFNKSDKTTVLMIEKEENLEDQIKQWMCDNNYISAFVEAGSELITSFLKLDFYHRIHTFIAPKIIGSGIDAIGDLKIDKIDKCLKLGNGSWENFQEDLYFTVRKE